MSEIYFFLSYKFIFIFNLALINKVAIHLIYFFIKILSVALRLLKILKEEIL